MSDRRGAAALADGLHVFVKRECPTCELVVPVLRELRAPGIHVYSQDDPSFPDGFPGVEDDTELERSFRHDIETVPTLIRVEGGQERERAIGWNRDEWRALTRLDTLGDGLPENQPGCGSRSVEPGIHERLRVRYGDVRLASRPIPVPAFSDEVEACFARGWSDGLPVVPPTQERVLRMLDGTTRAPDDIVGDVPPNLAPCTVEKVAVNAVLAGCLPEYMPVVLTALEAALEPEFTLHAITCSTYFAAPLIVVNGPITSRLSMNSGINVLGPGNRANATIGRALNLIVRNVGGAKPGEIDRATFGAPSKYTFCFPEDETDPEWEPLSVSRGVARGVDAVTLFQADAVQGVTDQAARSPDELSRSFAESLLAVGHPKLCESWQAVLLISPEHYAIYRAAGMGRRDILEAIHEASFRPTADVVRGARGIAEGMPDGDPRERIPKFVPDALHLVRAGGPAGLFSAILAGWPGHRTPGESLPVTKEIRS